MREILEEQKAIEKSINDAKLEAASNTGKIDELKSTINANKEKIRKLKEDNAKAHEAISVWQTTLKSINKLLSEQKKTRSDEASSKKRKPESETSDGKRKTKCIKVDEEPVLQVGVNQAKYANDTTIKSLVGMLPDQAKNDPDEITPKKHKSKRATLKGKKKVTSEERLKALMRMLLDKTANDTDETTLKKHKSKRATLKDRKKLTLE